MLATTMLTTVTMLMTTTLTTTMSTTTMSRFGLLAPGRDPKPPNEVSYYVSKYTSAESAVTNSSCNVPRCLRKRCGDVCPSRANVSASFAHKHSRSWATAACVAHTCRCRRQRHRRQRHRQQRVLTSVCRPACVDSMYRSGARRDVPTLWGHRVSHRSDTCSTTAVRQCTPRRDGLQSQSVIA